MPQARGDMSVILKSEGDSWIGLLARANGSVTASFGQGALPDIDVDRLFSRLLGAAPFALQDVSGGASPIGGMDMKSVLANGIRDAGARRDPGSASQGDAEGHRQPCADGALALQASAAPVQAVASATEAPATLFQIDGLWPDATVTPVPSAAAAE